MVHKKFAIHKGDKSRNNFFISKQSLISPVCIHFFFTRMVTLILNSMWLFCKNSEICCPAFFLAFCYCLSLTKIVKTSFRVFHGAFLF